MKENRPESISKESKCKENYKSPILEVWPKSPLGLPLEEHLKMLGYGPGSNEKAQRIFYASPMNNEVFPIHKSPFLGGKVLNGFDDSHYVSRSRFNGGAMVPA